MLQKIKPPTHKVILTGASLSIVLVGASVSFFFSSYSESNAAYSFTVDGRTGYIDDSGRTYDDSGVYRGDYNPSTGVYTSLDGATVNVCIVAESSLHLHFPRVLA